MNAIHFIRQYPKITLLFISYLAAFACFHLIDFRIPHDATQATVLFPLLLGAMYALSFSSAFATSLIVGYSLFWSPLALAVLGGIGSATLDALMLRYLKSMNLEDELKSVLHITPFKSAMDTLSALQLRTTLTVIGILIIASPLPDEVGILCVAQGNQISIKYMFVIGLIANALGIYFIAHLAGIFR